MSHNLAAPPLEPIPQSNTSLLNAQIEQPNRDSRIQPNSKNHKGDHDKVNKLGQFLIKQQVELHKQHEGRLRREVEPRPAVDGVIDD
jgi:hypothetical protein